VRRQASSPLTARFIAEVRALADGDLPADVQLVAKCCILDWLGAAIAGAREPLVAMLVPEYVRDDGGPCTLAGRTERAMPLAAALINGAAGDALDFSDCNRSMNGHATATVFPAALALAEAEGATGRQLLRAFVAGVEAACRIGRIVGEGVPERGFHPTAVAGPFGAVAASAYLLDLDEAAYARALGITATQAAGLADTVGTMCKPLHAGMAASAGLLAARLAARGFTGNASALDPSAAFLAAHAASIDEQALEASHGRFFILETLLKEYAVCQLAHGSVSNVLELKNLHRFSADDVAAVRITIAASSARVCDIIEPRNGVEAKFSVRTVVAMALLGYDLGSLGSFDDVTVAAPAIAALRQRISVEGRAELEVALSLTAFELRDGRTLAASHDERVFDPDLDRRRTRTLRKFEALTRPYIDSRLAAELAEMVFGLDDLERVDRLTRLLATDHARV